MTTIAQARPIMKKGSRIELQALLVRYGLVLLLIAVSALFAWQQPSFASPGSLSNLLRSSAISAIMFLGLTWIIAAGEIDVSFMSVAALSNMITAGFVDAGSGWIVASSAGIASGLAVGFLNGTLVALLRLPALVITIATGGLAASVAAAIGHGTSISLRTTGFVGDIVTTSIGLVPILAIAVLVLYQFAYILQDRMTLGHYIYAMEQNREAVVEAGIPVSRILMLLYLLSGGLSAVAGVLLTADLSSGQPYIGGSYFIDGLTAVLLGGMVLKMGQPNVIGTVVGILLLAVLLNGAALMGWSDSQRQIVRGGLLIAGVSMVVWTRRKARPRN